MGITIIAIKFIRKAPYFVVGWFWYLGTFLPVIGIVPVGEGWPGSVMSDRYCLCTFNWNIYHYCLGITTTYIEVPLQRKGVVYFSRNSNCNITNNNLEASESLEK